MTYLVLDVETIPDESRSHLWGLPKVEELLSPIELIAGTVDNLKSYLKQYAPIIPTEWLNELETKEMSLKKRASFLEAITEARKGPTQFISEMSFDPDALRIIAVGYAVGDHDTPVTLTGYSCSEVEMLQHIWMAMATYSPWIGFNNYAFDIPAIVARSAMLGVKPMCRIDWRRFGNSQIVDLMQALSIGGMRRFKGLKKVAPLWGIEIPCPEVDGSNIYSLYQANDWETISRYLSSDIEVTRALYKKLVGYFV